MTTNENAFSTDNRDAIGECDKPTMAANTYECMFLLDPTKVSGDLAGAAKRDAAVREAKSA